MKWGTDIAPRGLGSHPGSTMESVSTCVIYHRAWMFPSSLPSASANLGLTTLNCLQPMSLSTIQITAAQPHMPNLHRLASGASRARHRQPTEFCWMPPHWTQAPGQEGCFHTNCMPTTEGKTVSLVEMECPRQFLKWYSTVSLVAKVIKLITAKIVQNLWLSSACSFENHLCCQRGEEPSLLEVQMKWYPRIQISVSLNSGLIQAE